MIRKLLSLAVVWSVLLVGSAAWAQGPSIAIQQKPEAERFAQLKETLNGVALVGKFTILGKDDNGTKPERYEIKNVRKLDDGDLWLFNARIKYGKNDKTIPLPLEVKWVGNTPVIALDNLTIPGMGTFSSYVVIDGDKYAGTWTHGKASGHLFGQIEKLEAKESE